MNHKWKFAILTLLLLVTCSLSFGKKVELKLDSSGNLIPPNEPTVHWRGNVEWVIEDPRINSFIIEAKDTNTVYIFTDPLPKTAQTTLKMRVKRWDAYDWGYSISWIDRDGNKTTIDPKIPVKPLISLVNLILFIGFILASISSFVFSRKLRKANQALVANGLLPIR